MKPYQKHLDFHETHEVKYCVEDWRRDEQVRLAVARPEVGRLAAVHDMRSEPIAVVGFGPSLQDTWEQVKRFPYIISCSGSHKFLLEHGIVPTWHVEVDPRPHKVGLIGPPHPDVTYLIASACSPAVFDHLKGFTVKLWHVFQSDDEGYRLLPPGDWAVTGGPDVGMRALTLARFLGFTDLHVFGMDGCFKNGDTHAADHPSKRPAQETVYEGKTYQTTIAMLECAKAVWHELDMMHDVNVTWYGEGLIQEMAKHYVRAPKTTHADSITAIAASKPELISAEYRSLNIQLHQQNIAYGVGGGKHADTVLKMMESTKLRSVLDYGCGKGYLGKALAKHGLPIWEYDPAIPGKDESPRAADLVVCTDVLEHIEPDRLPWVLDDLRRCVRQVGFLVVHTGAAKKTLPDGRNTHLIQQGEAWWRKTLGKFFHVAKVAHAGKELYIVVTPKPIAQKAA